LHGMLLEVTEQDYQDFERQRRRERYQRQRATLPPEDTAALIRLACDANPDFETQILDQILIEKILATMVNMPHGIYEVKDIMRIMRVSRAYKLIQQESVPYMRVSGRYKIPAERFHQWLDSHFAHLHSKPDHDIIQS